MDLDAVLNFEIECIEQGRKEGLKAGASTGHREGRELGIQTGFLRYLPLGVLKSRADNWAVTDKNDTKSIGQLQKLVEPKSLNNDPGVVEEIERNTKLAKNKARIIATHLKDTPVTAHDQKITYQRDETAPIEDI